MYINVEMFRGTILHQTRYCANINTCDGRQITWSKELRYLGIFIVSSRIYRMMFAGLRQALVLSCSECDFWKNWTHGFRGCSTLRHVTFQRHHNTALLIRLRLTIGRAVRIYFTLHYIIVPKIEMYPNILACCRSLSVA